MSMRYQVRIRHPEHPHVFALRINACRVGALDPNTHGHRRDWPPSMNHIPVNGLRKARPAVRLIERG
jgi:hypothetical protein